MTKTSLSIGLIGAGFLARARVAAWRKISGAELSSVCSSTPEGAASFASSEGIGDAAADLDELLARDDIQAVDVCVPNRLHREVVERAAQAGKHILCTKPMAAYVGQDLDEGAEEAAVGQRDRQEMLKVACADAEAMVKVASESGVILAYAENWVHAPSIQRAAGLISASSGRLLEMRIAPYLDARITGLMAALLTPITLFLAQFAELGIAVLTMVLFGIGFTKN